MMAVMSSDLGHLLRTIIIGNAGSGKSRLAERIASAAAVPPIDLDHIHWEGCGYGSRRDEDTARGLVAEASERPAWVIEGVYGWLARIAVPRATALIWLDLSWEECRAGLVDRGLRRGMTLSDQRELVAWVSEYWTRDNANSYAGHLRLYESFGGYKLRLKSRSEADAFEVAAQGKR